MKYPSVTDLTILCNLFVIACCSRDQQAVRTTESKQRLAPGVELVGPRRWNKDIITWSLIKPSKNLPIITQREIIRRSFNRWSRVAGLDIREVNQSSPANIKISFEKLRHTGDRHQFDGRGGTLAHAFYPPDGRVHLDDDEIWKEGNPMGADLEVVTTHELGHALGLTHSQTETAVMSNFYPGYSEKKLEGFSLHDDDKRRSNSHIKTWLTGSSKGQNLMIPDFTQKSSPSVCKMKFDSITQLSDRRVYVFKNDWIYQITENNKVEQQWPKLVNVLFESFPKSSDAVTYSHISNRLYAFKEGYVWRYFESRLEVGFPQRIKDHQPDIRASFTHPNGSIYLITKRQVYQFTEVSLKVELVGQIKDIINGAPYSPDAVVCVDGDSIRQPGVYFFRGRWYYRLDINTLRIMTGYPRDKSKDWLGC